MGQLTGDTDGAGLAVKYGYDFDGNVTSVTYPGASGTHVVSYAFNKADQETSLTDWLGNKTGFNYDPDGNLTSTVYPSGITDTSTFDHADNLLSTGVAATASPGSPFATFAYTYNQNNEIATETDTGEPGPSSQTYSYNANQQMTSDGIAAYGYDLAGDPVSDTNTTNSSTLAFNAGDELCWFSYGTYSNNCTSRPAGAVAFTYNNDGERTAMTPSSGSATAYGYNQAGQLTSVTTGASTVATYAYDGTGERTSEIAGGTTYQFAYNTTTSTPEILSDGQNSYLYGPSSTPIEQISNTGVELYLHHDALGSVRRIGNQAGSAVAAGTYNSYGGLISSTGSASTPFQYAGAYTDPVTGFLYLNNRYYDPSTGQFITQDPDLAQTGQPYEYADDNPRNNTDPTGLDVQGPHLVPDPNFSIDRPTVDAPTISIDTPTIGEAPINDDLPVFGAPATNNDLLGLNTGTPDPALSICNVFELLANSAQGIPPGARSPGAAYPQLQRETGLTRGELSDALHQIKKAAGLSPDASTRIDSEGNVYVTDTGENIGNVVDEAHG